MLDFSLVSIFPANSMLDNHIRNLAESNSVVNELAVLGYLNSGGLNNCVGPTFYCKGHPGIEGIKKVIEEKNCMGVKELEGVYSFVVKAVYARCGGNINVNMDNIERIFSRLNSRGGISVLSRVVIVMDKAFTQYGVFKSKYGK